MKAECKIHQQPVSGAMSAMATDVHLWAPGFDSGGGGIAAFSRELANAVHALGNSIELWAKDDVDGMCDGLQRHGSGRVPHPWRSLVFAGGLLREAVLHRPDRVISTHPNFAPAALLAKRLAGLRYAVVAHGIDIHRDLSAMRRLALRQADAVWAVSGWTWQRCLDSGVAAERLQVIGNTVDHVRFDLGARNLRLRQRYGLDADEKVVLTVARLDPDEGYKGHDNLVRALPRLRAAAGPVRYMIVGSGGDRARVEALAAQAGVANAVTFCGFVSDEELPDHYRLADVFAMPSRGEGFGIVFLEAMACGVPVLGGNRDGSADALVDGALGELVDPDDVEALGAGLERLLRGEGPHAWFEPALLRQACLAQHGRDAFRARIAAALAAMNRKPG